MPNVTVNEDRSSLYQLVDRVMTVHQPVLLTGKGSNERLLSADEWRAIHETLDLSNLPDIAESILAGVAFARDEREDE